MPNPTYEKLISLLDENGAEYRLIDHEPEGRTELVSAMRGNDVKQAANCIVVMVKVGKKVTKYILAVFPADKKLDLEAVKALFEGTYVSFASPHIAEELAGSVLGTVLPFSFHDDLELIVDPELFENEEIFFNAARLDQSIALKAADYKKIAQPRQESIVQTSVSPSTTKTSHEPEIDDLYRMRHSLAHVLAQAVLKLWPGTQISIGPPIDTGCYYDFLFKTPITDDDFKNIEKEMRSIINKGQTFESESFSIKDAIAFWKGKKQKFKVELIEDLGEQGETEVTNYRNLDAKGNETFVDLCRGGHVENLNQIPTDGFKIMSLAGAYWRGDETREQLTRIYVAAFPSKQELEQHLAMLEEAKKRDHRKLGKELGLFVFSERVGPGLPMFLPKGAILKDTLERYIREQKESIGYTFVCIPHMAKRALYELSGHMGKYDAMMPVMTDEEGDEYVLKAMNCPHHFEMYNSQPHSYKEFPIRYAETTTCYRNEKSGELAGLTRVKALTQDDTHHFLRHDQIASEIEITLSLMERTFATFGFEDVTVKISVRDPNDTGKYFGDDALWEQSEATLIDCVQRWGVSYIIDEGGAAFYGPKIDIDVNDALGRGWQLTTVQLDFNQPENFDMTYTAADGSVQRPAVLHVAILGSTERFMGILIEHFAGLFPLWLAPVQVGILPVAAVHEEYAQTVNKTLNDHNIRTEFFDSTESLGKRIREGEKSKIPYLLVLGDQEKSKDTVTVRNVKTKEQEEVSLKDFLKKTVEDIKGRKVDASIG